MTSLNDIPDDQGEPGVPAETGDRSDRTRLRLYVASKSCHGPKWQAARVPLAELGVDIISTWIDESGEGETASLTDLWVRCVDEAASSDLLVAYHEPGEEWKGAFVEIGAALAADRWVYVIGRPPGSWINHPRVTVCASVDDAIEDFRSRP